MPRVAPFSHHRAAAWTVTAAFAVACAPTLAHADEVTPPLEVRLTAGDARADGSMPWTLQITGEAGGVPSGSTPVQWDLSAVDHDDDHAITTLAHNMPHALACTGGPATPVDLTYTDENAATEGHTVWDRLPASADGLGLVLRWCDASGEPAHAFVDFERVEAPDGTVTFTQVEEPGPGETSEAPEDPTEPDPTDPEMPVEPDQGSFMDSPAEVVALWQENAEDMGSEWLWLLDVPAPPADLTDPRDPAWADWIQAQVDAGVVPADGAWILTPEILPPEWEWLEEVGYADEPSSIEEIPAFIDGLITEGRLPADQRLAAEQLLTWVMTDELSQDYSSEAPMDPTDNESAPVESATPEATATPSSSSTGPVVDTGVSGAGESSWLAPLGGGLVLALLGAGAWAVARQRG